MSKSFEKYQNRRLRSSYLSVIVSVGLVLFLMGLLGLMIVKTKTISDHFKEQVAMTVFLNDDVKQKDIEKMRTSYEKEEYVKSVVYISKEFAAEQYSKDIGEDFIEYLGANPLKNAIDIYIKSDFVTPEKMNEIEVGLIKNKNVFEVSYDKPLIDLLTKNIQRISFWVLIFSGVFTLIAVVLINSAIRLSVYSKRFTIKTMQMVGATKGFIRRPFIWKGVQLGIIGSFVAILGIITVIYYLNKNIPEIQLLADKQLLVMLFGVVMLIGIVITFLSTYFATQRFLNLRTEELYY
ncbi:cell division protein FtsX [Urechidicola vernalis]|uniref:Cell division protein FtsX n=1 Tax=Urechidicola vernalis TaxID=3075600 RepID=A0ABU2Y5J7_9FLAO|nr:permease-like cell division protein FtsX [Urechidicola sp. P050]MDT0553476.1 permease-like cell division protein FtsX [Urechidicola sp. P050]